MVIEKGKWKEALRMGKRTGMINSIFNFMKKDGSVFIGDSNLGFFIGPDNNARISIIIRDNTEKQKKAEELKASEERYRRLFETAQDGILILDFEKEIIIDANKFILDLTGYSLNETLGKSLWELGFVTDKVLADEAFCQLGTAGYIRYADIPLRRKNGESIPVEFVSNVYMVKGTKIVQCNIRDTKERVEGRRKLETSELRYRRLFETAQDGILILDYASEKIIDANKFILDITGYVQNEVTGKSLWELGFVTDKVLADEAFSQLRSVGYIRYEDIPLRRKNGAVVPVEFISNVYEVDGTKIVQCNIRDISERQLRDAKIKELANIVDSTADAVIGKDLNGTMTSWNKGAEGIYGYTQEEILGRSILLLASPNSRDDLEKILTRISQGEIVTHFETTHLRKNGSEIDVSLTVSAVRNDQGIIIGSSIIASNITERKRLDMALQEVKKKLNLLSSITRHDINNQLMVLLGNLELLGQNIPDTSSNTYLLQVKGAAKRISATVEFTKTYEDIGVHKPNWHEVRTLVATAARDVQLGQAKVLNECPSGFEVFADPLILKVFANLIDNAIRHGEKVTTVRFYVTEKEGVHSIVCEDDGIGVEADMKERLFTRGFGKDHGLGLFLSREIVSITGISLEEAGMPGHGAKFVMTVPPIEIRDMNRPA
jgi:PAS domain S-box-containing protein